LNRLVALKLLAPERVGDAKFAERFTREAQALAALNHPNIVTIHDFGQAGGFYFLLMEFVDGVNLRQLLRARKFTPEEALAIVPPLCDALQFAHERGIVHRDIKPENLLLDKAGRVKVADFGIARMIESEAGGASLGVSPETAAAQPHDATGVIGTPGYSAPEQKTDPRRVDSRADIYSLGVVFYEMLTGELPGKRIEPPSRKVQIDVRLDEIVLRALEKNPELRYQQVSEVKTMVETIAGSAGVPPAELRAAHDAATNKPTNKSSLVLVIEILFGITFTSPLAIKLVNLSALGFLGFLSFLVYAFPERHWCLGLSSFFGFFGLIGFAYMVEMARRRKPKLTAGAFPTDATPDRAPPANIPSAKAHFSRAAIVGACWTPLFFITFVFNVQSEYRGPLWGQLLLMVTLLPLGFAAPFCTTILGWLAVSQICRSAGKLHGLWLAVFDGLLFPLLALDFILLALGHFLAMIIFSVVNGGQFTMNDAVANQQVPLLVPTCVRLAAIFALVLDFFIIRRVWRAINTTKDTNMKKCTIATITVLCLTAFFLAAYHYWPVKSDYIGESSFPKGDSIKIASVSRTKNQMVVKGQYNLVSADSANLDLYITTPQAVMVPTDPKQVMEISNGQGNFELSTSHLVPGWPHVTMYSTNGGFAGVYFGTKKEAAEERERDIGGYRGAPTK
jgi:hypothetical protein